MDSAGRIDVEVPGGRIGVESVGDGPAVVALHAGVADRRMWRHVVPGLAESYRVITFDARGFGESPMPTEPYRQDEDLLAVLDALDVDAAHLVGASMGGRVAMQLAVAQPERVRSLALLASALLGHTYAPAMHTYFEAEEAALTSGDIEAAVQLSLDMWVRGPEREWTDRTLAVADELRPALRVIAANQAGGEDLEVNPLMSVRENLATIAVPTLVVIAESDPIDSVTISEHLAASIPGARAVRLPDTGHLPALERPTQTLQLLSQFLAGQA